MKPLLIAMTAIVLGAGSTSLAQNMVEYSNIAGKGASAPKAMSSKITASTEKIAAAGAADASSHPAASKSRVQEAPTTQAEQVAGAKPTPPAIFILSNGERIESNHYVLTADSVRLQQNGVDRTIPVKALDVNATTTANQERGLHLMFPTSSSQMMLSF